MSKQIPELGLESIEISIIISIGINFKDVEESR